MGFETRFDEPGTLPKPGLIGRLLRLLLGAACLWGVYSGVVDGPSTVVPNLPHPLNLIPFVLALWLAPAVLDIGWGVDWKRCTQLTVVVIAAVLSVVGRISLGSWWTPLLGWFVLGFTIYVLAHLGISFVLAAVLGTPGCEMRALPHLWTLATGQQTQEHYCPGFLDAVDRWERFRREPGSPT